MNNAPGPPHFARDLTEALALGQQQNHPRAHYFAVRRLLPPHQQPQLPIFLRRQLDFNGRPHEDIRSETQVAVKELITHFWGGVLRLASDFAAPLEQAQ